MADPFPSSSEPADPAVAAAAAWLARRDRGLTAAEQDDYLQWLASDPRHPALMARQEAAFALMSRLSRWQPGRGAEPNPDLFAPVPATPPRGRWAPWALAAAALAVLAGGFLFRTSPLPGATTPLPGDAALATGFLRVNERRALPDGSLVELKDGSRIDVDFSPEFRRVRLHGEAHFTVAKNPVRPFVVEAGGVAVRAVGTAFNVRLEAGAVDVLVTEGRVSVEPVAAVAGGAGEPGPAPALVEARQRTVVPLAPTAAVPEVVSVTPEQVREALAWQAPRLQFFETPLGEAVAEFNRRNTSYRLILHDADLARVRIGGTFRIDNVEGFVRLLEVTLGIRSEAAGNGEIRLRRLP
jgi:transmembrane sensor